MFGKGGKELKEGNEEGPWGKAEKGALQREKSQQAAYRGRHRRNGGDIQSRTNA